MYVGIDRRTPLLKLVSLGPTVGKKGPYPVEAAGFGCHVAGEPATMGPELLSFRGFDETRRMLRELKQHQGDLERQNEELRLARTEVQKALEKYRGLYDFAPAGYLALGRDGAIRGVNLFGSSLLGIDRTRLLGRPFGFFLASEARAAFSGFLGKVFSSKAKEVCEVALLEGEGRPSFVQIETVAATSGEECYLVVIDISARRSSAKELATQYNDLAIKAAKLEEANLELDAFNCTVSHELCTPLTNIIGYSQVLQTVGRDRLDQQSMEYLKGIADGNLRMKRLIASLFDFSRVTRVRLQRENVDLSQMARSVAGELKLADPERHVRFQIPEGITVHGDAGLCRVILVNLFANAWKHSVGTAQTAIEFGRTELGGKPVFFVCDNGPGFDMADAGKLFTPFQRIPGVGTEGHGIGLATVKRIVKRHGGRVWAESSPGEGATFFYTLE